MGMSWFLQVSPHVLSSQQIIKGERNYPHLNKENWLYHPWTDGIRVLAAWAQQFSLSILYFWAVSGSSDSARQRPLQAKGGRWVLIPLWEGTALPPADTALWSVLWYAQTRKGLYGPDFQKPGMFCVMSFPPPPQVLNNLGFKNNSWVLCLFIWSPQDTVASFPPSATRAQNILSFSEFFLRRWYSLCII